MKDFRGYEYDEKKAEDLVNTLNSSLQIAGLQAGGAVLLVTLIIGWLFV